MMIIIIIIIIHKESVTGKNLGVLLSPYVIPNHMAMTVSVTIFRLS